MKIVIQRVKSASVSIDGIIKEKINQGSLEPQNASCLVGTTFFPERQLSSPENYAIITKIFSKNRRKKNEKI